MRAGWTRRSHVYGVNASLQPDLEQVMRGYPMAEGLEEEVRLLAYQEKERATLHCVDAG